MIIMFSYTNKQINKCSSSLQTYIPFCILLLRYYSQAESYFLTRDGALLRITHFKGIAYFLNMFFELNNQPIEWDMDVPCSTSGVGEELEYTKW